MHFSLHRLSREHLLALAESRLPTEIAARIDKDALPPAFVAARSLARISEGESEVWCSTFLVVRDSDKRIVGGCGFKTALRDGRVEIGYGISPENRRQGAATAAVKAMLTFAFSNGASEVLAEIVPENSASTGVAQKLGFRNVGTRITEDDGLVAQWVAKNDA